MNQIYFCVGLKLHVNYSGTINTNNDGSGNVTVTMLMVMMTTDLHILLSSNSTTIFFKLWAHSFNMFLPLHSIYCINSVIHKIHNTISLFILQMWILVSKCFRTSDLKTQFMIIWILITLKTMHGHKLLTLQLPICKEWQFANNLPYCLTASQSC